jgi:hypothetical protein
MDGVTQIAVPATIAVVLSYIFDYGKLLLANVPGFRQSDADHAKHMQLVFWAISFLLIGVYSYLTSMNPGGHPADINGWFDWLVRVGLTAGGMTFGGALYYAKVSMNGGKSDASTSDPSATQNGLPLTIGQ